MRVAVTGTPGTGKTTVSRLVETDLAVVNLNTLIEENDLIQGQDTERESWVADLDAVREFVEPCSMVLIESHLAHHIQVDQVIVLRCHPTELRRRLQQRGASERKIQENVQSEILDIILAEAVDIHGAGKVYELDTTAKQPAAMASCIERIINGECEPRVGTVSFLDEV